MKNKTLRNDAYENLKQCLQIDVIGNNKPFSWRRVAHRYKRNFKVRYIFWWRIASYLHFKGGYLNNALAKKINRKITLKYGTEIQLGAKISPGITFGHHVGIVISRACVIGVNFHIRQNTTIGVKKGVRSKIKIGDNVEIGANCCIIGDNITIGNNVVIGAMAFINKNIPNDSTCFTNHFLKISKSGIKHTADIDTKSEILPGNNQAVYQALAQSVHQQTGDQSC
ncbi:serine acetyltransferase [Klebsiella oxytoca]|uniref:serine acetyltransferase n=1 Tax=Klebsiella oxytoca TaxID=571 RepID=UPI002AF6C88E|nr:serine acetyltransferase [Klebsiella oxytoca]